MTIFFAKASRQEKTNKQKRRNFIDLLDVAHELNVADLLPVMNISTPDLVLGHLATRFATQNFYVRKTIASKVYARGPVVIENNRNPYSYPFTKMVLKGIQATRQVEYPVGVVLGKDILHYFNSSLEPEKNYYDLLLVTFD